MSTYSVAEKRSEYYPGDTEQRLAISAVDASANLTGGIRYRVFSTVDAYIRIGASAGTGAAPAATAMPISAGVPELFCFGGTGTIAVHGVSSSAGSIYFTPMSEANV